MAGALAGALAGLVSGAPSTLWAVLRRRDPLEAIRAAGSVLAPDAGPVGLYAAAAVLHTGLSLGWGVVLAGQLPRRHPLVAGTLAGVAIAALDLGIVGRRFPRVRALPLGPQVADHALYGLTVGLVLTRLRAGDRRRGLGPAKTAAEAGGTGLGWENPTGEASAPAPQRHPV